ncbi:hypothetical protein DEJ48_13760 [Streptomyces venezuelae]|uniref:Uncharacterized protein n=1 Tax=Streptomyces venezuelae TaxID=54571 RepID=A0A5P2BWG9_STRVZ|nr:hypothetical protein [Streptomyces venezuelae]QES34320.1 hypothetical protein DEJ48_13760 [Streptomyces venezuelae]
MAELKGRVEVEELLDDVRLNLPAGAELRARGGRRQARRRIALSTAAVTAVAGAVLWAVVPEGGDGGRDVRPAERPEQSREFGQDDTPYKKDGVVRLMRAERLPLDKKWHWREGGLGGDVNRSILRIGLKDVGCAPFGTGSLPSHGRHTQSYQGLSNAVARHRYAEFRTETDTDTVVAHLRNVLDNCGMVRLGQGPDAYYTGSGAGPRSHLRVQLTHGERWLSVVETLDDFDRAP